MLEVGVVVKTDKKRLVVQFARKSACDKCHMCAFKKKDMTVTCTLQNSLNAKVGDKVSVQMGGAFVLTSAFVVYIIPVVLMMISLIATQSLVVGWQVGLCMTALAIGFGISVVIDKLVKKKSGFSPQLVAILTEEEAQKLEDEDSLMPKN